MVRTQKMYLLDCPKVLLLDYSKVSLCLVLHLAISTGYINDKEKKNQRIVVILKMIAKLPSTASKITSQQALNGEQNCPHIIS